MSKLRVFVTAPLVSADVPACAKLGNLYGHSSYFPCVSCNYKGVVCGCKRRKSNAATPARWDNRNFRETAHPKHALISGDPKRTLNRGEHIAFVDTEVLLPHHVRSEAVHLFGLQRISETLQTETNQALIDRERKEGRSNGPSVLSLLGPSNFTFTTGFAIEAMHTVIKGAVLRLWKLTVSDKYKKLWFNVQYYDNGLKMVKYRLTNFKFPIGSPSANKFVNRRHSLKAEELYTIIRVCGHFLFNNIVPKSVVYVWALFSKLFTNLLHYHVSKTWMNVAWGLRFLVKETFSNYLKVFGPCNMPSNFHRILHCWLDFRNWGPMRTHWAFPYERVYGALSATSRMQNRSQVTMSIVNAIHLLYATTSESEGDTPGRRLEQAPCFVDVEASDVTVLLNAGYLCPPLKTNSVPIDSTFALSLSLRNTFFVLKQVTPLTARKVFDNSITFYTMPTALIQRNEIYGRQCVFSTTALLNSSNAIGAVIRYNLDAETTILIPSFGFVEFK